MDDEEYRRRIFRAEDWARIRVRRASTQAHGSFLIPPHRRVRYAALEAYFISELARPEIERTFVILDLVLAAIETDVYGLEREPVAPEHQLLFDEAMAHAVARP